MILVPMELKPLQIKAIMNFQLIQSYLIWTECSSTIFIYRIKPEQTFTENWTMSYLMEITGNLLLQKSKSLKDI